MAALGASKNPRLWLPRREASAVCPRRRAEDWPRAERGSPTGHDIGQPACATRLRQGRGTGGDLKRVAPAATPPKYRGRLEFSGNPKVPREIMAEYWDASLATLRLMRPV
jgi:hypothetical protein